MTTKEELQALIAQALQSQQITWTERNWVLSTLQSGQAWVASIQEQVTQFLQALLNGHIRVIGY